MTNAVVQKTKHIEESYVLQYGTPVLANGVGWDAWSARVNVCAERMVVVFEACNETGRRDDAGVGLLRWRQGVPVFGESKDVFAAYEEGLSKEVEEQERVRMVAKELSKKGDDAEGKKRAAASKGTTSDLGRGRWLSSVRAVVDCCARDAEALGARGALAACQALDDAYWTGSLETPRVLAAAWSPPMCGGDGGLGCMVAVCFDDGSLMLFSKPKGMTAFWVPEINLSRVHVDVEAYVEGKKKHVVQDVVYPGTFLGVAWSTSLRGSTDSLQTYSVIGGITELGDVELFKMAHNTLDSASPEAIQSRLDHVGTLRLDGQCITQVSFVVSAESENATELVAVCGCESGEVVACSIKTVDLEALKAIAPGIDGTFFDLVAFLTKKKMKPRVISKADGHIVTSLAATCTAVTDDAAGIQQQVTIAVGKTVGIIQLFVGGTEGTIRDSMLKGTLKELPKDDRPDTHSISGLALMMGGRLLVASSRLGNMVTLRVPDMVVIGNPVHLTRGGNNLQYQGFGCYGLAASPGGVFVALAKQSQEPDREFRVQQQIHQMITQGYLHIQSIVGTETEAAAPNGDIVMAEADGPSPESLREMCQTLKDLVSTWVDSSAPAGALWDAERMAALLENLLPRESMAETLLAIQREAGVSRAKNDGVPGTWSLRDPSRRTYRTAAAMLHVLRALQGDYEDQLVKIADWEMISMQGHLSSIFSKARGKGSEKTESDTLTLLLAIDLVVAAHGSHPWIFPSAVLKQAEALRDTFDDDEASESRRRVSMDLAANFVATMTTACDGTVASMDRALEAHVVDSSSKTAEAFTVMRCPATLQGNLDGGRWICSSCKRSYISPPHPTHLGLEPGTVACILCASKVCADIPYYI